MPEGGFSIDLSGIWQSLIDHLGEVGTAIWAGFSQWLYGGIRGLFLTLWHATLLPIPHDVTDQFTPVLAMMPAPGAVATAGLVLALSLLGLRTYVRGITGRGGILDELLGRIMLYTSVLSMMPWLIGYGIDLEQRLARAVVIADISETLPQLSGPSPSTIIALLLMIILGLRLWLKLASNVVHIAVAIVWSPVALICGLMPESSWVTSLWIREFVGRLAGAVLATVASGLGFALALTNANGNGDFVIFGVAGAFIAAHDLVDWLARTPGSNMGGPSLLRLGIGAIGGGMVGTWAATTASGGAASSAAAQTPALPAASSRAMYSYD